MELIIDKKGLTILELIISVAIVAFLSLAMGTTMLDGLSGARKIQVFNQADEISNQIGYLLKDPIFCTGHFSKVQIPKNIPEKNVVKDIHFKELKSDGTLDNKTIIKVGDTFDNKLQVSSIRLSVDSMAANQRYLGSVNFGYKETGKNVVFERSVPVILSTDSNRNIVYCGRLQKKDYREEIIKEYTADCADYSARGWPSKEDCMKDGRWHIVFQQNAGQHLPRKYKDEFLNHIANGAEARVGIRDSDGVIIAYESCNHISTDSTNHPNMILCLTGARSGVNNWETHNSQKLRGGVVYFNDGSAHAPGWSAVRSMGLVWYVKY